ncbi:MAG: LLM class F420-dependent oxidoreductase [Alphaproteobacteria bacterium]
MDYGFNLPARGPLSRPEPLREITAKGEALGYSYLTVPDHIVIPNSIAPNYPYSDNGEFTSNVAGECLEQLTQIAYLAGMTSKVKFLTSVMVVPHRMPVHNAKTIATIDFLSGGRIVVGVGAGWMEEEFEALGTPPFKQRGKVTDEYLAAMKTLWTEDNPSFKGEYVSFSNIGFAPKPVQKPHPPIWVGGESGPALRRVVRHGDAWFPIGRNPKFPMGTAARLGAAWSRVKQLAEEAGRDPGAIELGYWTGTVSAGKEELDDEGNRRLLTGSTSQIVDDIGVMRDLGVKHTLLNHQRDSLAETLEAAEQFMTDVAAKVG